MSIAYLTTPNGEELAILPRAELEELKDAVEHTQAVVGYQAGLVPGLTSDEARQLVLATSPLSFWRKYRGLTQAALAGSAGVTQHYLSDIENGKRVGDVNLWSKLARVLELPIEVVVDDDA